MSVDWAACLGGLHPAIRSLAAGEVLFRHGDAVRALYRVERGCLRLGRDGVTVQRARAGSSLAEASLFLSHHDCDAIAETATTVRVHGRAAVLLHLRAHPDLNLAFSAALAGEVESLRAQLEAVRLPGARDRVLAWLRLKGAADGLVSLDSPLATLAAELGLSHEVLYRTLAALVADGVLERPGTRSFRLIS